MRKFCLLSTLVLTLFSSVIKAQDFSNKGKEFWLAYSYHVGMVNPGGPPVMTLYITSDLTTTYSVEIFGVTTLATGTINAGQVITVDIPTAYFINGEGSFTNKAIRVVADKPVVVYSYITRSAASGATLCLPTAVLGREYISMNYTQISNEANSNSFITIVAVENNTNVEITPSANTKNGWIAGTTYTVTLNKGGIYQVLGVTNAGNTGVDLTGSTIRSVASAGGGCKRIAVFSGSGKISIGCPVASSSDNLYQQLYPIASWGKKYLTIPSYNRPNAIYRIAKSTAAANVYLNGVLIPAASFINNVYYEFSNSTPNKIESDQPVCVAQYFSTQGCAGNGSPYDPDMIILNPVEQNIDKVTLVSSNLAATVNRQHHLHVIMKNGGTALSSFKLDGAAVFPSLWTIHTADPAYSYIYFSNISQGYHTLSSDTGFNALAYGYADAETYGYSAGSNIKDLYQYVTVDNQYATVDFPAACKSTPFFLSMTFPYQPTQIIWQFNGLFPDVTINAPVYDQTTIVDGRTLYKYKLPGSFTTIATGVHPIKIIAQNPTADGCSGVQEIDYDLEVFEPPVANFSFTTNGCVSSPVSFTDNSNNSGRPIAHWHWNFADGNIKDDAAFTTHNYAAAGSYNVKYTIITDVGCKADTVQHTVVLNELPVANFTVAAPYCAGKILTFSDASPVSPGAAIAKWIWNFGDGSPVVTSLSNANQTHTYANTGPFNVTLQVETVSGCLSTVFTLPVTVHPDPVVDFNLPNVCLPAGTAQFNSLSTISDGTGNLFTYSWNFGDASPLAGGQAPVHNYTAAGPYNVSLTVTSNNSCSSSVTKSLSTVYAEPVAAFAAPAEVCLGPAINFTDQSTAANSTVTQWSWDFGDATTSSGQNPVKTYALPGTYTVKLSVTSAIGCQTVNNIATRTVVVNPLPAADFNTSLPGCETRDITFTDASSANAGNIIKWTWNYGDGNNAVRTNGTPFIHNYVTANTYPVTLQVETDKGCISTLLTKPVAIHPVPDAGFILPEICLTDPVAPFIDTSRVATGSISLWNWNFGDPNATPGSPNTSTLQNPGHRYNTVGSYTATLIVTTVQGCTDTIAQAFIVNGSIPVAGFTVQAPNTLCSNADVAIADASTVDFGNIVKVQIYWDFANDPSAVITDDIPAPGRIYMHRYPEFGSPAMKTYTIRYVAYSGISCVSITTRTISVLATPSLQFSAVNPVCAKDPPFQLTQAQLLNVMPGTFVFTGDGVSSSGLFNPSAAGAGLHTIRYTYTGTNGCSNYKEQPVQVYPVPTVDAGPDRFMLEGGLTTLLGSGKGNSVSFLWTPAGYLTNNVIAQPIATPPDDIYYTLLVTSADGCKASDEVFVKVLKAPVIPNIFSPNGDGVHDKWEIGYLESYPGCVVQIYNRYGQLVYRTVNYTTPWDGRINGQDAPVGTYYYIIDPGNGRKPMTGFVDIIR